MRTDTLALQAGRLAALPIESSSSAFLDPAELLIHWKVQQRPQSMNAQPLSHDGVTEAQNHGYHLWSEVKQTQDLCDMSPRDAKPTCEFCS